MSQISLYIDEDLLDKIEKVASVEHLSVSKWVSKKIRSGLDNNWPEGYFSLYGSVNDNGFVKPKGSKFENDIKRMKI